MSCMMSLWQQPSTLHPTGCTVFRISSMVLESSLAKDQGCICQTMLKVSSKVVFPLSLMFFCFFLSPGWFLKDFDDQGRGRRCHLNLGQSIQNDQAPVILRPDQSPAALAVSSPTFFGDKPRGLRTDMALTFHSAPQVHYFNLLEVKRGRHGRGSWCRTNPDTV